ncbi:leucine-rich repeat protein [Tanacetum coccineum]
MSAFSFSHFSSCYLWLLVVVALFHLCLSKQNFDDVLCIKEERQALLEFKHRSIDETDRLASWVDEKNDCCKRVGIVCESIPRDLKPLKRSQIALLLGLMRRTTAANQIHLNGHCLSEALPTLNEFEEFSGYLNLSSSSFDGIIPPQLRSLSDLHTLYLGSFQDDGWPGLWWLLNLHLLRHLDTSMVDLSKATDWFQVINNLPSLTELHLKNSYLLDTHPHVPTLNIISLLLLDLSENEFIGHSIVPQWIFSITSLVSLDLSERDFNGLIPISSAYGFRNLTSLKMLDLADDNDISVAICAISLVRQLLRLAVGTSGFVNSDIVEAAFHISEIDCLQFMDAMKDWKRITSMLLGENPSIELTDDDATNMTRLLFCASVKKTVGERIWSCSLPAKAEPN